MVHRADSNLIYPKIHQTCIQTREFSYEVLKNSALITALATITLVGIQLRGVFILWLTGNYTTLNYAIISSDKVFPLIKWGYIAALSVIAISSIVNLGARLGEYLSYGRTENRENEVSV